MDALRKMWRPGQPERPSRPSAMPREAIVEKISVRCETCRAVLAMPAEDFERGAGVRCPSGHVTRNPVAVYIPVQPPAEPLRNVGGAVHCLANRMDEAIVSPTLRSALTDVSPHCDGHEEQDETCMACCDAEARLDPPWGMARRPFYDCSITDWFTTDGKACHTIHSTIPELIRAHPGAWDPDGDHAEWRTPVGLWVSLRSEAPDILWGTTVRAMGKRLAAEGWTSRYKGNQRVYYLADLPKGRR
jgi:hypothetical protein